MYLICKTFFAIIYLHNIYIIIFFVSFLIIYNLFSFLFICFHIQHSIYKVFFLFSLILLLFPIINTFSPFLIITLFRVICAQSSSRLPPLTSYGIIVCVWDYAIWNRRGILNMFDNFLFFKCNSNSIWIKTLSKFKWEWTSIYYLFLSELSE